MPVKIVTDALATRDANGVKAPVQALKGSDASVTPENIIGALGYTPISESEFNELKDEMNDNTTEIGELKGDIAQLLTEEITDNQLFDDASPDIKTGGYYQYSGVWKDDDKFFETGYMPTNGGGEVIYISIDKPVTVCWYNASKALITGNVTTQHDENTQKVVITSSTARYFRVGLPNEFAGDGYIGLTPIRQRIRNVVVNEETFSDMKQHIVSDAVAETANITGDLANLNTTNKSNLVAAINEAAQSGGGSSADENSIAQLEESCIKHVETTELSAGYYKYVQTLRSDKRYMLVVITGVSGRYTLKCGYDGSAAAMTDEIGTYDFVANQPVKIKGYTPTGNYNWLRLDNVAWSVAVYEYENIKDNDVLQKDTIEVMLDAPINISSQTPFMVGFSGSMANGFSYDGVTDNGRLRFEQSFTDDATYIVEFDITYTAGDCVAVGFSSTSAVDYATLCYNGSSHIVVPVKNTAKGRYLNFWVRHNVAFTLTNITVSKINPTGTNKKDLDVLTLLTKKHDENYGFWNVLLGGQNAMNCVGSTRTIAIGNFALGSLRAGHRNIGIGTFAMSQMVGGENNVSIGADSMLAVKEGHDNIAIGKSAMYNGTNIADNIAIGDYALSGSPSRTSKFNVAIGKNAGVESSGSGNTLVGHQAGYRFYTGDYNTMIGFNSLGRNNGYYNICIGNNTEFAEGTSNSIVIGKAAKSTKSGQMVLGTTDIAEVIIAGKKISFNADGSVTWTNV